VSNLRGEAANWKQHTLIVVPIAIGIADYMILTIELYKRWETVVKFLCVY